MAALAKQFKLLTPVELDALPEPSWLIEGMIPANSFCVLYGEPGCFKTFVALSMSLALSGCRHWCGKTVKQANVLYIAAEGLIGLKLRVRAYQIHTKETATTIRYLDEAFRLLDPTEAHALATALEAEDFRPDLIVMDTFARMIAGADENSAKDIGIAVQTIDHLRQQMRATALLIHHTGKNSKSERGSSALRGAADVMIECTRIGDGLVQLRCDKMKDAEPFQKGNLGLMKIQLGTRTSLAVTDWKAAMEHGATGGNEEKALQILRDEFGAGGATNKEWKDAFISRTKSSESSFSRALRELKQRGAVVERDARYFVQHDGVTVKAVS